MTDPATGQRSFLQALKVPFDLKGVAVGAMAWAAITLGTQAVGMPRWKSSGGGSGGFLGGVGNFFGNIATSIGTNVSGPSSTSFGSSGSSGSGGAAAAGSGDPWMWGLLLLFVGAFFGVAGSRIAAMRLARDQGVGTGESLAFSAANFKATFGAVLFMAGSLALFWVLIALAGLVSGIPGVGPILMIALFPLALVATLILFLLFFGTCLGLPLTVASLAVERNGPLDAVSRAFSYVFSRPVLFFFYALTVGFIACVLGTCVHRMEAMGMEAFAGLFPSGDSWGSLRTAMGRIWPAAQSLRFPDMGGVGVPTVLGAWFAWLFATAFHLALMGWVVYYAWGGFTAAYFALRRDVDGTEEEEIWVEGEDKDRFGPPEKPEPVSASAKPADATPAEKPPA